MQCPYCGATNRDDAAFCLTCRATLGPGVSPPREHAGAAPAPSPEPWQTPNYERTVVQGPVYTYAAFWPRFGAWLLDALFSTLLAAIPAVVLAIVFAVLVASNQEEAFTRAEEDRRNEEIGLAALGGFVLGYVPVYLAYHTIANAKGGGWGKRIAGLRVLRERDGALPGYGTGFLRAFVPVTLWLLISILWLLDHLWCIWDRQKQTWHDKIAGTVVVAIS
jgi:uncharacterized RDD family membrane protein YckC